MPDLGSGANFNVAVEETRTADLKAAYGRGFPEALTGLERHAFRLREYFRMARVEIDRVSAGRIFADAAQHLAHMHETSGNYAQGAWWAEEARYVAQKIKDKELLAIALGRSSIIKTREGEHQQGIRLAQTAIALHGSPWSDALVGIQLAHALRGSADRALRALEGVENAIARGLRDGTPRPVQTVNLTISWQDYHRGAVLVRTRPQEAERHLLSILNGLPEAMRLTRGNIQVRRAIAATSMREFERAIALAKEGLEIADEGKVAGEVITVMRLRNHMGKVAPAYLVKELDLALQRMRRIRGSGHWRTT
jgi:tetratricopeptide (TPR) repeat protein